ncbi:MAG: DMT family transporter [Pseudomonadota bacterium]
MSALADLGRRRPRLKTLMPWAALMVIGTAWGLSSLFAKIGMTGGFHALGAAAWQAVIGACVAVAALRLTRRRLPLSRAHCAFYLVCGILGTALPATLSFESIRHLSVGIQTIVIATVPMLTVALALPLGLERAEPKRLAGVVLGFAAMVLLVWPQAALPGWGQAFWMLLPLISALCYAGENVVIASWRLSGVGPLEAGCGLLLAATFLLLPPALMMGVIPFPGAADPWAELALVATALFNIGAYLGYVWLIGRGGPVFTSQIGYVVTLTGVLSGILVLGESHDWTVWLALGILFAGIALVSPRPVIRN